jgi:hypothetical protein
LHPVLVFFVLGIDDSNFIAEGVLERSDLFAYYFHFLVVQALEDVLAGKYVIYLGV